MRTRVFPGLCYQAHAYLNIASREAKGFIDHANFVKVIFSHIELIGAAKTNTIHILTRKLARNPVKYYRSESEISYFICCKFNLIAPRNIPPLSKMKSTYSFANRRVTFIPKWKTIVKLVSKKNVEQALLELKEYATEINLHYIRKYVIKLARFTEL